MFLRYYMRSLLRLDALLDVTEELNLHSLKKREQRPDTPLKRESFQCHMTRATNRKYEGKARTLHQETCLQDMLVILRHILQKCKDMFVIIKHRQAHHADNNYNRLKIYVHINIYILFFQKESGFKSPSSNVMVMKGYVMFQ